MCNDVHTLAVVTFFATIVVVLMNCGWRLSWCPVLYCLQTPNSFSSICSNHNWAYETFSFIQKQIRFGHLNLSHGKLLSLLWVKYYHRLAARSGLHMNIHSKLWKPHLLVSRTDMLRWLHHKPHTRTYSPEALRKIFAWVDISVLF